MQVRKVAEENGVDVSGQIRELEERAKQVCYFCCPCVLRYGHDVPDIAVLLCKSSGLTVSLAVRLACSEHASSKSGSALTPCSYGGTHTPA